MNTSEWTKPITVTIWFILIGVFSCSILGAQTRSIVVSNTKNPPKIDGYLNDPVWQASQKHEGFFQFDPYNGQQASEVSMVMLAYDSDNLYIGIQCHDSDPAQIAASMTPREQFRNNDYFTIILDTFNDRRTSYEFTVNPRGVQKDRPGDYLWASSAQITDKGWQAEIKIPFKSIRFSKTDDQIWGVNFERYIFRLKETDYFTRVGRDDVLLDKSATLTGLSNIRSGKNLELFPYAGFRDSQSGEESEQKLAGGLDIRYGLTSNLNLDFTMSPDFSEVESDPFFYQLSPYEVELSERRPFFQESRRYFPGGRHGPRLFYSKRIENPRMAGKLTGKQGPFTIGAIGAVNKEPIENGYIGAVSLQRDLFKFSKVGAMFSGYSNHDFENLNGRISADIKFSEIFSWDASVQFAYNSDLPHSQNMFYKMSVDYEPDEGWNGFLFAERIEKNFKPRAGIWRQTDAQMVMIHPGYRFRINKKGIKQLEFEWFAEIQQTSDGLPLGYTLRPLEVKLSTLKGHYLGLDFRMGKTKVQLEKEGSLFWHNQYYNEKEFEIRTSYDGNRFYQIRSSLEIAKTPVYNEDFTQAFDGTQIEGEISLALRPTSNITLSLESEYTKQTRQKDDVILFEGALSGLGINWQITRYVYFSTVLQHDSHDDRMKIDALLGVELGMGKNLSISYKSRGSLPLRKAITGDEASTLLIKASYLFRI